MSIVLVSNILQYMQTVTFMQESRSTHGSAHAPWHCSAFEKQGHCDRPVLHSNAAQQASPPPPPAGESAAWLPLRRRHMPQGPCMGFLNNKTSCLASARAKAQGLKTVHHPCIDYRASAPLLPFLLA